MKSKILHYIKEIIFFLVTITILSNIISFYKSSDLNSQPLDITTLSILNNSKFHIDDQKPILIHFWATWCPTCRLEATNIDKISQSFQVITIAVKSGENNTIQNFLKNNNLHFKVHNDKDAILAKTFNLSAYPTTFIYDKNRKLIFSDVGYTSTLGLYLRMLYAQLF